MPQMIPLTEFVTAGVQVGIVLGVLLGLFCWLTFHAVEFIVGAIVRRFDRSPARDGFEPVPSVVVDVTR